MLSVDNAGTLSVIGVYPQVARTFPIGEAMNKNLAIQGGNCNHRKYIPTLIEIVWKAELTGMAEGMREEDLAA
ncbi:MAG: hypothetical protein LLF99_06325 [Desulfobacteraceae bacterium]|nr:hypothetical protein [Desulfobacteraceae bacterium]